MSVTPQSGNDDGASGKNLKDALALAEKEDAPKRRSLSGKYQNLFTAICCVWATFHLVTASGAVTVTPHVLRAVHLCAGLSICFLLTPAFKKRGKASPTFIDWLWIAATVATLGYSIWRYPTLVRMGGAYAPMDIWMGVAGMAVLFEGARRVVSPGLVWLAAIAIAYAYFGQSLPDSIAHAGYGVNRLIQHLYLSGEGVFGFILGVSAEIIIVFVLFGAVLEGVGVSDFFNKLANSIAGGTRGGPAKIAVISSALMGMVSGETSANVATTGVFTIPLMKKVGYPPYFAGAVECSASAGGQILPPIMGATAFVMADALGIPYTTIAIAAFFPAVLYFFGVFCTVHFRAVKLGLKGMDKSEIPSFFGTLKDAYLLLPLAGIVVLLLRDYTPTYAAFWGGLALAVVVSFFKKENRLTLEKLKNQAVRAATTAMSLAIACALVGTIVGVASLTGVTMTIAEGVFNLASGQLLPGLFLTMIVTIVLGMGLPTTAAYVLAAISSVPVLLRFGVPELNAHMFVFYFGAMSALTPPVCTGAYTAAGLAGADPNQTGFAAVRLALAGFIVPFLFIYDPLLAHSGGDWSFAVFFFPFLSALLGLWVLAAVIEGAMFRIIGMTKRVWFLVSATLMLIPESITNWLGFALLAVMMLYELRAVRIENSRTNATLNKEIV
jgi:TRAP transporter 4TM/12TM fusion protein